MNILLSFILVTNCLIVVGIVLAFRKFAGIEAEFRAFITPESDNKLSPLASTVDAAADMVGRALVAQLKSTFMGKQSGAVRAENAIAGDIVQDTLSGSPIGAILSSFPSLTKSFRRNPQLLDIALGMLSKKAGSNGSSSGNDGGSSSQAMFKL